jgi:hypothetical protein
LKDDKLVFSREADESAFWSVCRHVLIHDTERAARLTGLPELNRLMRMQLPQDAIRTEALVDAYRQHNPSTNKANRAIVVNDGGVLDVIPAGCRADC